MSLLRITLTEKECLPIFNPKSYLMRTIVCFCSIDVKHGVHILVTQPVFTDLVDPQH